MLVYEYQFPILKGEHPLYTPILESLPYLGPHH